MRRLRIGPGPVFAWEWRTGARRWQFYAGRALFGTVILLSVWTVWAAFIGAGTVSLHLLGMIGPALYYAYVISQLGLILLVTPAITAGAICQEKARGSLLHLMTTDLSDVEIVVGKLAARLVPVAGLLAAGLPILMLCGLLGGLDPNALIGATAVTAGAALICAAAALTISVWAKKPQGALMAGYFLLFCWLVLVPIGEVIVMLIVTWLRGTPGQMAWIPALILMLDRPSGVSFASNNWIAATNPLWMVIAPYRSPGAVTLWGQLGFLGFASLLAGGMAGLSVLAMRRVYVRQLGRPPKPTKYLRLPSLRRRKDDQIARDRGWLPGPSLDGNPVLWREWHRNAPSLARRIMWHAFTIIAVVLFTPVIWDAAMPGAAMMGDLIIVAHGFTVTFGLLLMSVGAASSLGEERSRGSLDVLMTTPLPTSKIVWGKWWGVARVSIALAVLPAMVALLLGLKTGDLVRPAVTIALLLAFGALITSVGLAIAVKYPSQGKAIGLSVACFCLLALGWPMLVALLTGGTGSTRGAGLMLAAPWYGSHRLLHPMARHGLSYPGSYGWYRNVTELEILIYGIVWVFVLACLSGSAIAWTLARFNAHLGRMDERSRPPAAGPRARSSAHGPGDVGPIDRAEAPSAARQT